MRHDGFVFGVGCSKRTRVAASFPFIEGARGLGRIPTFDGLRRQVLECKQQGKLTIL